MFSDVSRGVSPFYFIYRKVLYFKRFCKRIALLSIVRTRESYQLTYYFKRDNFN